MPLSGSRRTEALSSRPPRRRRWRIGVAGLISLLVHLMVGVLLLVTVRREEKSEPLPPPSKVTMLFDTGRKSGPTLPNPSVQAKPSAPVSPAPSSPAPPMAGPAQPPPVVEREPAPPQETRQEPVVPPPPVPETKPEPAPPSPPPPTREATPPPPPAAKPEAVAPAPPVAKQPAPRPPEVKPAPERRLAANRPAVRPPVTPKAPNFPAPMDFSFGTPAASSSQARRQARPHIPGTIDMSLGPAARGAADNTPFSEHDRQARGADWRNALSAWVAQRAYYPHEAARNGEEGDSEVHVVAAPNGRVEVVELVGKSGSMWLDLALLSLFRDQHIPPLPYGSKGPIEFNFTMHYILIRPR